MVQLSYFSKLFILLLAALAVAFTSVAHAGIKCWKTSKGVRECGYQVPNEYRKTRIELINKSGVVFRVIEAPLNKKQLAAKALKDKEIAKIAERKRKDGILLKTFTTERDLIIARDNRVGAVQSLIEITQSNINSVRYNLRNLRERAGDFERGGKKLPKSLLESIKKSDSQITHNNNYIKKRQSDIAKIKKEYKFDLDRFRYLKSKQKRK